MPLSKIQTTLISGETSDSVVRNLLVPSSPTNLTVSGGNTQAVLSWTSPTGVLSQAPITDYVVQVSLNSGSSWSTFSDGTSTATSATVTGLTNGTAYVFRVAAVNGIGTGAYSTASSAVTPSTGTPPNAPTSLTATAGNAQLSLSWTAPSAPGTYAITGYTVEYTPSGGSAQNVATGSTNTSYTLTGLTNGTAYTVRVAAVSAAGTGTYTAASSSVTPFGPTSIAGLQLWLDASDSATLFDATAGGSLVAADGGVARWQDKSGNARHATQATSGSRPLRKAAVQGGRDVLRFDGTNDSLSIASSTATFNFLHSADSTVLAVVKAGTTGNPNTGYVVLGTHNGSGGTNGMTVWYEDTVEVEEGTVVFSANNQLRVIVGAAGGAGAVVDSLNQGTGGFTANTFKLVSIITKPTQATAANRLSARVNGGAAVSGNQATKAASSDNSSGDFTVGSSSGQTFFLNGDIAEIIIYNSALIDADRSAIESYLMSKYSIS